MIHSSASSLIWFHTTPPWSPLLQPPWLQCHSQTTKHASILGLLNLQFLPPETLTLHLSPWPSLLFLQFSAQNSNRVASLAYMISHCLYPPTTPTTTTSLQHQHEHHHPHNDHHHPLSSLSYLILSIALTVISLFYLLVDHLPSLECQLHTVESLAVWSGSGMW